MPLPFNKLAALKLIPMSFPLIARGRSRVRGGAKFRRLLQFLGDSAFHTQLLIARHLQDHAFGLVQILRYLVLTFRILMHFDYIFGQNVLRRDNFWRGLLFFWQIYRNGRRGLWWGRHNCRARYLFRTNTGHLSLLIFCGGETLYRCDAHIMTPRTTPDLHKGGGWLTAPSVKNA